MPPNLIHLTRYTMYNRIKEFFKEGRKGKVLCISGKGYIADQFHPNSEMINAEFPKIDVQKLPYSNGEFDFVLCDCVIEHVENPFLAVGEMYRVLKVGGWVIITTALMIRLHKAPTDFWRFTPDGLKVLCKKFSGIYQCEGWGNPDALSLVGKGLGSEKIHSGSILEKIATRNDNATLITTWIIARK